MQEGTAAVQLTRLAGAVPIVTAGSPAKLNMAKSLGAVHGFNYKEDNFAEKVLEVTGGLQTMSMWGLLDPNLAVVLLREVCSLLVRKKFWCFSTSWASSRVGSLTNNDK